MERFTLAPNAREILVNRAPDAADDLFSYGPETPAQARSLGHLFVVGHTDDDTETTGYLVSLVAAMAKREYYASQPAGDAKQSFARMLRKVNEVVEEFSKTNEADVDVGIFAVAGSTLYVSRLGKFRILLARDGKVTDVLKDVSQFSKEVVQKRRFSSIISGPVQAQDRLLAYYPQLALTRREKVIKTHLHDASVQELSDRLADMGAKSPSFTCSLMHIDMDQVPVTDAPDLSEEAPAEADVRLAWRPRQHAPVTAQPEPSDDAAVGTDIGGSTEDIEEAPHIIPSEFSHRSRTGSVARAFRNARLIRSGARGKMVVLVIVALAIVGGTYAFKSFLFTDEAAEQLQSTLDAASQQLDAARAMVDQDRAAARAEVLSQLPMLKSLATETHDDAAASLYASYLDTLNEIDRAEPASVTLEASVPPSEGIPRLGVIASGSGTIWLLADSPNSDGSVLIRIVDGQVTASEELELEPDMLVAAAPTVLLADTAGRTLQLYGAQAGPHVLPTPDRILAGHWFLDYAYLLTSSGILKVQDLETVKPVTKQWLNDVAELSDGARLIAVDGDVWVLSADGTLTKYFRGDKVDQARLPLTVTDANRLLTTEDMPFMYVTDAALKRVHVIDKESMQLIHTVTVDTEQDVLDFFMGPDYALHMLASDGKIWRVE